jgi:hypothetical protein
MDGDPVVVVVMQPGEREMTVRLPSRWRRDRGSDAVELAPAEPGWIALGRIRQPSAHLGSGRPRRHHDIEPAAEQRAWQCAVVLDALLGRVQLGREQRAQLDRPVVGRGCGECGAGSIERRRSPSGSHPELQRRVEVRRAPRGDPRVAVREPRDRCALTGDEPRPGPRLRARIDSDLRRLRTGLPERGCDRGEVVSCRRGRCRRAQLICDRTGERTCPAQRRHRRRQRAPSPFASHAANRLTGGPAR